MHNWNWIRKIEWMSVDNIKSHIISNYEWYQTADHIKSADDIKLQMISNSLTISNCEWYQTADDIKLHSCILAAEKSHASFSTWILNEYERSHASFSINMKWISCHLFWLVTLFFEWQINWDIWKFYLIHSKQFAEITDSVQVTVLTNFIF